jgi:TldD protein
VALRAIEVARASATAISRPVELVPEPVHIDSWATPVERDPFSVALEERIALLVTATNVMRRVPGVKVARGTMDLVRQQTWFASSEG